MFRIEHVGLEYVGLECSQEKSSRTGGWKGREDQDKKGSAGHSVKFGFNSKYGK